MISSFITFILSAGLLFAQQEIEEKALLEEEKGEALFFSVEEFVTTAGRMEQRIEEAPVAITVITEEDIRYSGASNIPEILRIAAGIDVVTLTAFDSEANVRGFSMPWTNKLLVLIDGRYTYEDFLGITVWNSFPIQLGDIKKIEIIKGPGSVLYGANAYSGVVNIITKSPEESRGLAASLGGGQFNHYFASLIYGGSIGDLGYSISGGLEQAGRLSDSDHDEISLKGAKARGQLRYKISGDSSASLDGGIVSSKGEQFILAPDVIAGNHEGYIKGNYSYSNLKTQAFWRERRINFDIVNSFRLPSSLNLEPAHLVCDIYDMEAQHLFKLGDLGNIMAGLNYRLVTLESNYLQNKEVNLYAGFLQYELKPIQEIIFNAGVRLDKQDYRKLNTSPRGAIIVTPYKNHTFRASISTAFRNPTFVDAYPDISIPLPPPLGGIAVVGNEDLKPERITSYDLGYHTTLFQRLKATVDLFYYDMSDFIRTWGGQYSDRGWIYKYSFNKGKATGIGGEIGFECLITSWLKGLFNYSYQKITDQDQMKVLDNPNNKFNIGARLKHGGLSANIIAHYVGPTRQEYTVSAIPPKTTKEDLGSYVLLNARVAYGFFNEHIELALSGQNLLNYENYKGKLYNFPNADPIPLMVLGSLNVKF